MGKNFADSAEFGLIRENPRNLIPRNHENCLKVHEKERILGKIERNP